MENKLEVLYKRDKSGKKILSYEIEVNLVEDSGNKGSLFATESAIITKTTGFLNGKKQKHTDLITQGKQNRTVWQQAISEAESAHRSKKDEGYKELGEINIQKDFISYYVENPKGAIGVDRNHDLLTILLKYLPEERTDASGVLKPMKCTATNDTKSGKLLPKVLAKIKYPADVQTKLDGVRCFATNYEDGFRFTSSAGKSYDTVCRFIKNELDSLNLPIGTILDGELYIHGKLLQKLSGWCRKQSPIEEHTLIEFHIFDIPSKYLWIERRGDLEELFTHISEENLLRLKYVPYYRVHNIEEVIKLHDEFTIEGYEGAIIRNSTNKYAYGIRSTEIFKMKNFQDAEFVVIGADLGKRGSFDMTFTLKTKEGKSFKAKPLGDAADKEELWNRKEEIMGKEATVRFLSYSEDGIPTGNTVLKCIRDYEN